MSSRDQLYPFADGQKYQDMATKDVFRDIYQKHSWNIKSQESVSGEGSDAEQTYTLRMELPALLNKLNIQTLLDIPCGDFHWMSHLKLGDITYIGADIVPELAQRNHDKYANKKRQFISADLIKDPLPECDLIFCRDCLVHLSNDDIFAALKNIKSSRAMYLMMTHFPQEDYNKDIVTGGWRLLNFCLPPFDFPEPETIINENCSEMNGVFRDKSMALWPIKNL